jgi:hypothetical protein
MTTNPTVNQNSVITSIFSGITQAKIPFLTCGGTNILPKSGAWANFTVKNTNFRYIFNIGPFNGKDEINANGYSALSIAPTTIKESLYDGNQIQYICGRFTLSGAAQNITYFNPIVSSTATSTFNTLNSISFTGTDNAVNCMTYLNTSGIVNKNRIVIAGTFTKATISGTDSTANIALLNYTPGPTWNINTTDIISNGVINASTTIINSIIVIGNIIYVAGAASTNCLFYSYDTIRKAWNPLLSTSFTGTINVIKAINTTQIAVGGRFTTIGAATACNNVAIYTIASGVFRVLGAGATKGVTDVAASSPIYIAPVVFALTYVSNFLFIGGYFVNAGGTLSNSIAVFNVSGNTWSTVTRGGSANIGLLKDTGGTDPGVVYAITNSANDTGVILVGGSFITSTSIVSPNVSQNIYNLVKITVATITSKVETRTYSNYNSLSTTPAAKS